MMEVRSSEVDNRGLDFSFVLILLQCLLTVTQAGGPCQSWRMRQTGSWSRARQTHWGSLLHLQCGRSQSGSGWISWWEGGSTGDCLSMMEVRSSEADNRGLDFSFVLILLQCLLTVTQAGGPCQSWRVRQTGSWSRARQTHWGSLLHLQCGRSQSRSGWISWWEGGSTGDCLSMMEAGGPCQSWRMRQTGSWSRARQIHWGSLLHLQCGRSQSRSEWISWWEGALCGVFKVIIPQTIEVVSGSCVTIPCSFDVTDQFVSKLDKTCKALWKKDGVTVFDSSQTQTTTNNGQLTGDLTKKDCTTTLNNIQPVDNNKKYTFRLECNSDLKYNFPNETSFSVTADPPRPTLTPSTLEVKEGTPVSLTCSAPAPCLSHPPTLTWTPGLGDSQETLQENQVKTKVQTSVVKFTASHLHHGKTISCTATYNKQDGSAESAVSTSLTANISVAPEILPSSNCTKAGAQLNCSCETVGNPSPTLMWYLDGSPVNNSDNLTITYEPPNDTGLRSIITVNQPQERDLSTLLCRTSNSLGSATHHFCAYCLQPQSSAERQECPGGVTFPVFIITVGVLSAALFCALLFAIRARGTGCRTPKKSQSTGDTSPAVMSQGLTTENGNKVSGTSEEDIYANTNMMKKSDMPNSDVVYSSVIWKSKEKKGECSGGTGPSGSSYLEEERCMEGGMRTNYVSNAVEMESLYDNTRKDVKEAVYSEYAQVHFRDTNVM
ncbi:uncharacterized protein LOC125893347 [Epinephelus fuscoguttatus]|uniref:uncharacterized protein LOC125893347 n=1 Tax=Epinephelus fuscoguttatus TaxID=293821 RepID=UPI0020CFE991|nr:uncharacterized protein LOC125893347 [Epinephelus fuscoguttatus]